MKEKKGLRYETFFPAITVKAKSDSSGKLEIQGEREICIQVKTNKAPCFR